MNQDPVVPRFHLIIILSEPSRESRPPTRCTEAGLALALALPHAVAYSVAAGTSVSLFKRLLLWPPVLDLRNLISSRIIGSRIAWLVTATVKRGDERVHMLWTFAGGTV
jgi:hypothetical protein